MVAPSVVRRLTCATPQNTILGSLTRGIAQASARECATRYSCIYDYKTIQDGFISFAQSQGFCQGSAISKLFEHL
jgi:hypothetical protein